MSMVKDHMSFIRHKKEFLKIAFLDLIFLLCTGYALTKLMDKVAQHLAAIHMISSELGDFAGSETLSTDQLSSLMTQQNLFQTFYSKILVLLFIEGLVFFVLWTLIEGYGWYSFACMRQGMERKKNVVSIRTYLLRFAGIGCAFLVLLTLGIWIFGSVATANIVQTLRLTSTAALTTLFAVLFVVLSYFWFVANSLAMRYPLKMLFAQTLRKGILSAKQFFPSFALVVIVGIVLYKIFVWLSQQYIVLTFTFIIIVLPLYLAWVKVANVVVGERDV